MKRIGVGLLALAMLSGCARMKLNTASQALAPGYKDAADQSLGEALAALNGFAHQEKANYANASAAVRAVEKTPLNDFLAAVDVANASYVAFHAGSQTEAQVNAAIGQALTAQSTLIATQGVK